MHSDNQTLYPGYICLSENIRMFSDRHFKFLPIFQTLAYAFGHSYKISSCYRYYLTFTLDYSKLEKTKL